MQQFRGRPPQPLVAAAAILLTAAALTLPAALGPVRLNDSFWIDWVWLDQFARELGNGVLYPRWLPLSHNGLGSPVFYYYPPLAFYAGAPFVLAGMSTYTALLATFFVGYVLSGAAMYWWLALRGDKPLLGALVFMIAPYHCFNFYERGAVAEFMATAFIPIVMGGLWCLKNGKRGIVITSIAYAALICTHLPLALLTSLFLLGPALLLDGYRRPRSILPGLFALGTGIALATVFWLPAIALESYRDSAKLWADPIVQPHNWTFWNSEMRTSARYLVMVIIGAALALPLAGLIVRQGSRWAIYGLVCVVLALGIIPAIWSLPLVRSVQFPFRILPLAEFALATAMAGLIWQRASLSVALVPLLAITAFILAAPPADQGVSMADVRIRHADVPENLPPGDRPYSWPSRWALEVASSHGQPQLANGVTTEPVFFFPAWRVRCGDSGVATFPAPGTQLLSYRGERCTRALGLTTAEKIGAWISLLGLLILIAMAAIGPTRRLRGGPIARQEVPA